MDSLSHHCSPFIHPAHNLIFYTYTAYCTFLTKRTLPNLAPAKGFMDKSMG